MSAHHETAAATEETTAPARTTAPRSPGVDEPAALPAPALATLLTHAQMRGRGNGPVRAAVLGQLQRTYGNRAVQRMLRRSPVAGVATDALPEPAGEAETIPTLRALPPVVALSQAPALQRKPAGSLRVPLVIQRWRVDASQDCADLVNWMNQNSPYAPNWAATRPLYSFTPALAPRFTNQPDGSVEGRVQASAARRVTVSTTTDMPSWAPTPRPNRAAEVTAWNQMTAALRTHENRHRAIGETQRGIMETAFRAWALTVTGTDRADARQQIAAQFQSDQQGWLATAQQAQDAIDPPQPSEGIVLNCP